MPSVIATAGAANANSYLTVAEGTTLADERLQATAWTGEDATDHARALIMATRRIDQLAFQGSKSASGQALKWPRIDVFDENGDEYATNAIPDLLKRATFEAALWLLNQDDAGTDPLAPTGLEGFNRARVGQLEVEPNHTRRAGALPDNVKSMLAHVLASGGVTFMAELERS